FANAGDGACFAKRHGLLPGRKPKGAACTKAVLMPARRLNPLCWTWAPSGMRPPGRGCQQFHFLGCQKRAKLAREPFGKVLVGEHRCPVSPPIGVVRELPEMHELVDHAGVGLEVAD